MSDGNDITRREAVARTALLLGGTLAASGITAVRADAWKTATASGWRAGTLTPSQREQALKRRREGFLKLHRE